MVVSPDLRELESLRCFKRISFSQEVKRLSCSMMSVVSGSRPRVINLLSADALTGNQSIPRTSPQAE